MAAALMSGFGLEGLQLGPVLADLGLAGAVTFLTAAVLSGRHARVPHLRAYLLAAVFTLALFAGLALSLSAPSLTGTAAAMVAKIGVAASLFLLGLAARHAPADEPARRDDGDPQTDDLTRAKLILEREVAAERLAGTQAVERKRRLDELILRTRTATVVLDRRGTIVEANHALALLLGRGGTEDLVGRSLGRLTGLRDDAPLVHFIDETLRLGSHISELEITPPTRSPTFIELIGAATVHDEQPTAMALIRDIAGRKRAERDTHLGRDELVATLADARRESAGKTDFLTRLNHEMRTPLNGMIGFAEILRHRAAQGPVDAGEITALTESIRESGAHLLSLIDDMLDLRRLEIGSRVLDFALVDVGQEIAAALRTLEPLARERGVQLIYKADPGFRWPLDRRAFRQIVINLANNALKFTARDTPVVVRAEILGAMLRVSVTDRGPGIRSEDRRRILSPFARGGAADRDGIDGLGLGLSIVTDLLALHGGRLDIEMGPEGIGACISASFPAADAHPTTAAREVS